MDNIQQWLSHRHATPVQRDLIASYLNEQKAVRITVYVLDLAGDSDGLMKTIKSVVGDDQLQVMLNIVVLTMADAPRTQVGDKLHFVRIASRNPVELLNELVADGTCDWLMLVRAGEVFTASGLMMAVLELAGVPDDCRAVYGDELQRLPDGSLGAVFRPDFNLDMLLSMPAMLSRHWLYRRDCLIAAGGFDAQYDEALEFELLLRLLEQGGMVGLGHISEPLVISEASPLADNAQELSAITRHLARRGYENGTVREALPGRYRINYGHPAQLLVSIIIPTKDQLPILQRCVESLLEKTTYAHYELLIVDNASETPEAKAWLAGVESMGEEKVRVLRYPHPFNYSAINNMAAREARGEYLVLLNNDTAVISESWLDELLNHAQRPEVGIVGAKLLYPDARIQHAGVLLGLRGPADHPFIGEAIDAAGYMHRLQVDQNYSAVTAACLMIRKDIYEEVGGLDEVRFKVSYNDIDLCLKVRELGYLTVWTPHAVVLHEGSVSQTKVDTNAQEAKRKRFVAEQDAMYEKWLPVLAADPAYNRNLSLSGPGFELETDPGLTWRPLSWRPVPVVLAHPADPWGCGNYRVIKPFQALQREGKVDGLLSEGLLQVVDLQRFDPDVLILQRQLGEERLEAMSRIKAFSRAFKVYELDDYLPNLPIKSLHREHMPRDVLKSLRRGLSFVDRFVVSTAPLADAFS
ncbi:MAG TPA: glycosyltransferase family 2 protein, partial [Pseudomonas sp.]|nr:glycosyltransferase family 2 protein [Pseudomonas sp.]